MNKKIFFTVTGFLFLTILIVACSKSSIIITNNNDNTEQPGNSKNTDEKPEIQETPADTSAWKSNEISDMNWNVLRFLPALQKLKCINETLVKRKEDGEGWLYPPSGTESIIGTWQLLLEINGTDTMDYSCNAIIYSFNTDSMVTIGSDIKEILSGTFKYTHRSWPYWCLTSADDIYGNLKIGEKSYECQAVRSWAGIYEVSLKGRPDILREQIFRRIK
jgi:hypothetical protein